MPDYESLKDASLLVARLEREIESLSAPIKLKIAELEKEIDDLTRAKRGKLQMAENLLEQIRLEITQELSKLTTDRYAAQLRGEYVDPIEKPKWLKVVKREKIIVTDEDLLPDSYWAIDMKALKKEKTEIPGTRRELEIGLQVLSQELEKETK